MDAALASVCIAIRKLELLRFAWGFIASRVSARATVRASRATPSKKIGDGRARTTAAKR
jgi:hypothetical protein